MVAAPPALRKVLDKQIQAGVRQVSLQPPAALLCPNQPPAPRSDAQLCDLRDEMDDKIKALTEHFSSTVVAIKDQVAANVAAVHEIKSEAVKAAKLAEDHEIRMCHIDGKVQQLADSVCTKADLSGLLAEALSKQTNEFRSLMAKGSPEPSPVHESAKAAKLS